VSITAVVVVAAPAYLVLVAGTSILNLAAGGTSVTLDPSETSVLISDIYEQLTWDVADAVPLIKLPETMGWERPIKDPDLPLGIASLVVRTLVVLITLATIRSLFRHVWPMRPEPDDSSSDETAAGTNSSSSDDTRVQPAE
jgi:hypothetical protein